MAFQTNHILLKTLGEFSQYFYVRRFAFPEKIHVCIQLFQQLYVAGLIADRLIDAATILSRINLFSNTMNADEKAKCFQPILSS